jgi:hypothetical protein
MRGRCLAAYSGPVVCVCTLRRNVHTHHRPFETGYLVDNLSLGQFCPNTSAFPYQYNFINGPFPFIHLSPTLYYLKLSLHNTLEIENTHIVIFQKTRLVA